MLALPIVLVPPIPVKPLKLYILAAEESIRCLLAQDVEDRTERYIYYLSRLLHDAKYRYTLIKKLCLSLFHACKKLEYYLLLNEVLVLYNFDIVKYLLSRLALQGHLMKLTIKLNAYSLVYVPLQAMKGKVHADFTTQHLCI